MGIPGQKTTINDPGMGSSAPASMIPIFFGAASCGVPNTLQTFNSPSALVAYAGQGVAAEVAAYVLANGGGPIRFMRSNTSVAAANSVVAPTRKSTSTGTITVSGNAAYDYKNVVGIDGTGTLGVGTFYFSLDNGKTQSPSLTIPAGGSYVLQGTGLTITFVPGAGPIYFEAGDSHAFTSTAAMWNATDLSAGFTAIRASKLPWRFFVGAGKPATAAAASALFSALDTQLNTLASKFRFRRAMMDGGKDNEATTGAAFTATSSRILVAYGDMDAASGKPAMGFSVPTQPALNAFARNATGPVTQGWGFPSTDLKRTAGGPVPGVATNADGSPTMSHDEFETENMDALGFSTLRTYPEQAGAWITQGRYKSQAGSDFTYWPRGICMDIACETVYGQQFLWIGEPVRTNSDGTIDARDAARITTAVDGALRKQLTAPLRAGGKKGHVEDILYKIDETHNVRDSGTIVAEVGIKPFTLVDEFDTTIGFVKTTLTVNANVAR